MAEQRTRLLGLIVPANADAATRANLQKLDALSGVYSVDSTNDANVQGQQDLNLIPNAAALGGSGTGGTINLGQTDQGVDVVINGDLMTSEPLQTLDQAVSGTKYLHLKYNTTLSGSVDTTADRTLSIDLQGGDRGLILGGDLTTAATYSFSGTTGAYVLPGPGTLVSLTATQTLTNKSISADSNTLTNIADANVKAAAAIALNKLAAVTASKALVSDGSGFVAASAVTSTELGYVSGVTSAIQTQLNAKQASSASLTALAALSGTGFVAQTGASTFAERTITGTANQIAVANGDGSGNPTLSLIDTAVTPNTYGSGTQVASFTVDAKGRLTSAASTAIAVTNANVDAAAAIAGTKISPDFGTQNVRTSGEFQFEDAGSGNAVSLSAPTLAADYSLTLPDALPALNGFMLTGNTDGTLDWVAPSSGGTVTSVALALPASVFSVSGSPIVGNGTLTGTLVTQNANEVWAGPASGADAAPTFRALVSDDIPSSLPVNKLAAQTASRVLVSDGSGFVSPSSVTTTTLGFLDATSSIQTQLDAKQATIALTANRAVASNGSGTLVAATTTDTELGYLSGVTSAVQTQLNAKQASGAYITSLTGEVTASGAGAAAATITNSAVIGKVLTGYVSGAGTVAATDTILQAVNKLNGNDALKLPLAGGTMTGAIVGPNGSNSAPTFAARAAGNGMYSSAASTLDWAVGGTQALQLNSSGVLVAYNGLRCDDNTSAGGMSILSYYAEADQGSTFTHDGTGGSTTGTITMKVTRIGRQVTVLIPAFTCAAATSGNSTALTANTALPSWAFPAAAMRTQNQQYCTPSAQTPPMTLNVTAGGVVFFTISDAWGTFTTSATTTVHAQTITYTV